MDDESSDISSCDPASHGSMGWSHGCWHQLFYELQAPGDPLPAVFADVSASPGLASH